MRGPCPGLEEPTALMQSVKSTKHAVHMTICAMISWLDSLSWSSATTAWAMISDSAPRRPPHVTNGTAASGSGAAQGGHKEGRAGQAVAALGARTLGGAGRRHAHTCSVQGVAC